jgi:hypothetical protein
MHSEIIITSREMYKGKHSHSNMLLKISAYNFGFGFIFLLVSLCFDMKQMNSNKLASLIMHW